MYARVGILDRPDRLSGWLASSILFHAVIAAAILISVVVSQRSQPTFGDPNGGRMGSVAVTPVAHIPLPARHAAPNPVANDTESQVPTPPPKAKAEPKRVVEEKDAIPLHGYAKPKPKEMAAAPNKFRAQQKDLPNQIYSDAGQQVSSPLYDLSGGGGIGVGADSPFGTQFGWYAKLLCQKVGQAWRTSDLDSRITNMAVVTFTLRRDGSIEGPVRVAERSGNAALDFSAQRAVLDAAPFPALPPQFAKNEANVELRFSLK